jgi:hypothetical protein
MKSETKYFDFTHFLHANRYSPCFARKRYMDGDCFSWRQHVKLDFQRPDDENSPATMLPIGLLR